MRVALVLEIAEVLFPTLRAQRGVDHDVAVGIAGGVAFEARACGCAGSMKLFCTNTEGPYTCGENTSRSFGMAGGLAPASNRLPPQFGTVVALPCGRCVTVFGVPSWLPADRRIALDEDEGVRIHRVDRRRTPARTATSTPLQV